MCLRRSVALEPMTNEGNEMRPVELTHVGRLHANALGEVRAVRDGVERSPPTGELNREPAIVDMRGLL
jgi:hypothetical protein